MNRFFLAGLTTLTFVTFIPSVSQAKPITYNPNTVGETPIRQITPYNLVTRAKRGGFEAQGISGEMSLTSDYVLGQIDAEEIVRAGIAAELLPKEIIDNSSYLSAVASQLQIRLRQH